MSPATTDRRANNLDFIRIILASLVILSHSTQLIDGNSSREPLARITPDAISLGFMAVNGFFLISGFLIVQSWLLTGDLFKYLLKRILRIYPGFIAASLVSIAIAGAFGAAHAASYWGAMDGHYLWFCFKRLAALRVPSTPPTFVGLPYPAVNGAIWTVRYEFCCYLMVAALGLFGVCKRRSLVLALAIGSYLAYVAQANGLLTLGGADLPVLGVISNWPRFASYFLGGMCFYLFRDKLRLDGKIALGCGLAVAAGCAWRGFSSVVLPVFGAYLLFYFAFLRAGRLHDFGKRGDYSYGIFCYGWPVQNCVLWAFHGKLDPIVFFFISFPVALLLAFCSWHIIEKPSLRLRARRPPAPITVPEMPEGAPP